MTRKQLLWRLAKITLFAVLSLLLVYVLYPVAFPSPLCHWEGIYYRCTDVSY